MKSKKFLGITLALLCSLASVKGIAAPKDASRDRDVAACHAVANYMNEGKLDQLSVSSASFDKLDINNDGKPEKVVVTSDGSMHVEGIEVTNVSGKPIEITRSPEDDWDGDNLRWAMDQLIIKFRGQIYIVGKTDDYLHYLSRVDKNNVEKVICQFSQQKEPVEKLVVSRNDRLCQVAQRRKLNYVEYDKAHALTHATVQEAGFYETSPSKLAALIDINNDGETELVVQLQLASGRGRGCGADHLGVLNKPRNKLNMEVTRLLPEPGCDGVVQRPFTFDGETYIEKFGAASNTHQIVQLKGNKLETICGFDVHKVNFVLGEYERIIENAKSAYIDPWDYALKMPGNGGLQVLLDAKLDPRYTVRENNFGTVIHEVIRADQSDRLEFLLKKGISPNVVASSDPTDMTPLCFAIWQGKVAAVRLLMKYGASRDQTCLGGSLNDEISRYSYPESVKAELRRALSGQ